MENIIYLLKKFIIGSLYQECKINIVFTKPYPVHSKYINHLRNKKLRKSIACIRQNTKSKIILVINLSSFFSKLKLNNYLIKEISMATKTNK